MRYDVFKNSCTRSGHDVLCPLEGGSVNAVDEGGDNNNALLHHPPKVPPSRGGQKKGKRRQGAEKPESQKGIKKGRGG